MRIGELSARSGVSLRTLRHYEEQGLLQADRSSAGQRTYPESAVKRVELIQQLCAGGVSSGTVRTLLPCLDSQVGTPEDHALLAAERALIDARIEALIRTRSTLDTLISTVQPCTSAACSPAPPNPRT